MATRSRTLLLGVLIGAMAASGAAVIMWRFVLPGNSEVRATAIHAEKQDQEIAQVPQRAEYEDTARWRAALRAHVDELRVLLASPYSREEKMLRWGQLMESLSQAISETSDPGEKAGLLRVAQEQEDILESLARPQDTIARAWKERKDGRMVEAVRLLELLADNPNYECPDVEVVLAYWCVQDDRFDAGMKRLQRLAGADQYVNRDLAGYLRTWAFVKQGKLQEARDAIEEYLATQPATVFRQAAEEQLDRLISVTVSQETGSGIRR